MCASNKALQSYKTDQDKDKTKYIQDEDIKKYPEALFAFVFGKRPLGMPVSFLRFMVFICAEGGLIEKEQWIL